jgi:hypothetical protein
VSVVSLQLSPAAQPTAVHALERGTHCIVAGAQSSSLGQLPGPETQLKEGTVSGTASSHAPVVAHNAGIANARTA